MSEIPVISLFGTELTLYALLAGIGYLLFAGVMILFAPKFKVARNISALYALLSAGLGLLFGRFIFCLVRMDSLFYDEMGDYLGLAPIFDPSAGSINVIGVILGIVFSAFLCQMLTKTTASVILDHAVLPALLFFAFMRFIEPLSGQGYGIPLEDSPFAFAPLASYNDWNEAWMINVSFIEGALALLIFTAVLILRKKARKNGSLALYAALLFSVTQIIPESLRCDDVLYIFIFARVTHIGLAVMLFISLLIPLLKGLRGGLSKKAFITELALMLIGIILCIGTIFALDKTNLPKLLVYAVMFAVLAALTCLNGRRIYKEDMR